KLAAKTTASASTQTDLKDKQITNLIQQWEQVAQWAKEEGIDINKRWNLFTLKKKLEQKIADLQDQINHEPIKAKDQTITETNTKLQESNRNLELQVKENGENEKVLEKLIKEFQELGEQLG
ncbi:79_t:CDS:2, partial [Racocetra persica]